VIAVKLERSAFLFVVSGPSGAGKTTLVDRLLDLDRSLRESVSVTTRKPRLDEVDGAHYFFVERDEFDRMKESELVEWAEVHGELYGSPRRFLDEQLAAGNDVVLNIDIQGGFNVKKAFPGAVMVFILPPSLGTLERRLRSRGSDETIDIERRLETAREEITASEQYDYIIVNDELETAVADLQAIVTAERCRRERLRCTEEP
jgi:guanylate kinase